jgi:hypothetical protein
MFFSNFYISRLRDALSYTFKTHTQAKRTKKTTLDGTVVVKFQ